jgi:hypothetical protein
MGSGSPAKPTANAAASLIDRKSAKRADFRMDSYAPPVTMRLASTFRGMNHFKYS